jgi:hypothetical protein
MICAGLYGAVAIAILLWAEITGADPFSLFGFLSLLSVMPWLIFFTVIYDQINPGMVDQFPWRWIAFIISVCLNGLLIYFLTSLRLKSGKSFRLEK